MHLVAPHIIGDVGSGFADVMHLERKSDLTEEFIKFVKNIRAMYGKDHDYELFQRVLLWEFPYLKVQLRNLPIREMLQNSLTASLR
eukprot:COSAG02_NODE_406_length_22916_cov_35.137529_12_plen_86_part_00